MTVVIPNFNRGHLLRDAIESVLTQSGAELEVLVCDDGSTDDSESVVTSFSDPRVRWLPGERSGGPAVPRNRGIEAARGEWIAFLDSDDTWGPGKLEAQFGLLEQSGALACSTNAHRFAPGHGRPAGELHPWLPAAITLNLQLSANFVVTSSMLVAAVQLRRAGGFPVAAPLTLFEDYALWLRLAQLQPIRVLDMPLVNYRDDAASSIRGAMRSELRCTANSLRDFARWRRSRGISTSVSERAIMARQLSRLVSVRKMMGPLRAAESG